MFAATKIEAEIDQLLDIIGTAANRLETIRETDRSGLQLDGDIRVLREAVNPERFKFEVQPGEGAYFQRDTPRTNPQVYEFSLSANPDYDGPCYHVEASFARTLERELSLAKMEVLALENTVITTIGGKDYEGNPTSRINFLQRLRILMEKEARLTAAESAAEGLRDALQNISDLDDSPDIDLSGDKRIGVHCGVEDVNASDRYEGADYGYGQGIIDALQWAKNLADAALENAPESIEPDAKPLVDVEKPHPDKVRLDWLERERNEAERRAAGAEALLREFVRRWDRNGFYDISHEDLAEQARKLLKP